MPPKHLKLSVPSRTFLNPGKRHALECRSMLHVHRDLETPPAVAAPSLPARGVYVRASKTPGMSIVSIVDSNGVCRCRCEIDTSWCDEQAVELAWQKLEASDPVTPSCAVVL